LCVFLGDSLVSRFKRASKLEENSSASLLEILASFPGKDYC